MATIDPRPPLVEERALCLESKDRVGAPMLPLPCLVTSSRSILFSGLCCHIWKMGIMASVSPHRSECQMWYLRAMSEAYAFFVGVQGAVVSPGSGVRLRCRSPFCTYRVCELGQVPSIFFSLNFCKMGLAVARISWRVVRIKWDNTYKALSKH